MSDEGGEKTEEPTQKKIDDSRKKGQVWKSRDLTGLAVFLTGMAVVKGMWPTVETEISTLFRFSFEHLAHPETIQQATGDLLLMAVATVLLLTAPVVLGAAIAGGLTEFLQVGPLFSQESLMPKLEKLNPLAGLKNMFSKKQLVELLKSSTKISIAGYVVYGVVRDALGLVMTSLRGDSTLSLAILGELVYRITTRISLLFLVFAIFDVWWQRRSYMKDLMMTKDEVKREYKESEGDPHHKAKRKEMHHEILEGAMMESVKKSDVVVTNPDHVAVALRYDRENDAAPRVIAKGIDSKAEAIKALAKSADVTLLRNVPLAHALLRLEVGEEIPEELYDAVAEVLNFVFQLKQGADVTAARHL